MISATSSHECPRDPSLLESDGWVLVRTKGSHRQFKHSTKSGTVTVAGKPGEDIPRGTLNSILKQAGLKTED
ncbi:MAG: type II toxin-antitoxin system HicA family toxin [Rhodothermales bacterium]|nr:type II toxin-antitoxin system HicA family toxin [Rhodothermales bacterium]